jgi:hypothetical protein
MHLPVRHSGHDECDHGVGVGQVRDAGGGRPRMEVEEDRVLGVGDGPRRMEVADHEVRMDQLHVRLVSRWAGLEPHVPGPVEGREARGGHDVRVFHHGAGKAGMATDPKGCRSIRLPHYRGCHQRQGG